MGQPAIQDLSFEQALGELETIVRKLESGQAPLDDSIGAYEHGMALKNHCESKLAEAKAKVEKITLSPDGTPSTQPLDTE